MIKVYDDSIFSLSGSELSGLYGARIKIRAALVVKGSECFLVSDVDVMDLNKKIVVYFPGLERKLDCSLGGWVGGPASYLDTVEVVGILFEGTTRRELASLSDIESLILERDGEKFVIN